VQALEVAHRVHRAHMHLHPGDESEDEEDVATALDLASTASYAGTTTHIAETHAEALCQDASTRVHLAVASEKCNEHLQCAETSEDSERQEDEAFAMGKANQVGDRADQSSRAVLLGSEHHSDSRAPECLKRSRRSASVHHFFAHMEVRQYMLKLCSLVHSFCP
jgi:hypothetical protein